MRGKPGGGSHKHVHGTPVRTSSPRPALCGGGSRIPARHLLVSGTGTSVLLPCAHHARAGAIRALPTPGSVPHGLHAGRRRESVSLGTGFDDRHPAPVRSGVGPWLRARTRRRASRPGGRCRAPVAGQVVTSYASATIGTAAAWSGGVGVRGTMAVAWGSSGPARRRVSSGVSKARTSPRSRGSRVMPSATHRVSGSFRRPRGPWSARFLDRLAGPLRPQGPPRPGRALRAPPPQGPHLARRSPTGPSCTSCRRTHLNRTSTKMRVSGPRRLTRAAEVQADARHLTSFSGIAPSTSQAVPTFSAHALPP